MLDGWFSRTPVRNNQPPDWKYRDCNHFPQVRLHKFPIVKRTRSRSTKFSRGSADSRRTERVLRGQFYIQLYAPGRRFVLAAIRPRDNAEAFESLEIVLEFHEIAAAAVLIILRERERSKAEGDAEKQRIQLCSMNEKKRKG